jgi:hypothetical protein
MADLFILFAQRFRQRLEGRRPVCQMSAHGGKPQAWSRGGPKPEHKSARGAAPNSLIGKGECRASGAPFIREAYPRLRPERPTPWADVWQTGLQPLVVP